MSEDKCIVIAKLQYNGDVYYLSLPEYEVTRGTYILIETQNGPEIALVCGVTRASVDGVRPGRIIRIASEQDLKKMRDNEAREEEAFRITLEKIKQHNLDMKLVSVHYFYDDNKIIFNFTADERVDFRELVKELASVFKKRIELRQIGARDEAKIVKGTGICGRDFCCNAIKNELQPVTIKMAKDQNLTLNSSKISGACGRLLCCLAYEHEAYREIKRLYPQEGSTIEYEGKRVTISEINVLKMEATLKTDGDLAVKTPLNNLRVREDREKAAKPERKTESDGMSSNGA